MHQFPAPPDPPLPPAPTARPKHRRRPPATARTTRGTCSAANWVNDRHVRAQARRGRVLTAAMKLGLYVPPEAAARLAVVPAELRAPVHPSQILYLEFATKTLGSGGPDVPGRGAAGGFSAPRVQAADGGGEVRGGKAQAAPVEKHGHGLLQRGAVAARRAARMGKHDKDPMPMERLPGAGLVARAAGIAAATEAGGAGTAGADAILAALPNRAARRRWKSLQRRKHRGTGPIG